MMRNANDEGPAEEIGLVSKREAIGLGRMVCPP